MKEIKNEINKKMVDELLNEGFKKAIVYNRSVNQGAIKRINENGYNQSTIVQFSKSYPFSNFLRGKKVEAYLIRVVYVHFSEILYKIIGDIDDIEDDEEEFENKYKGVDFDETFNELYSDLIKYKKNENWKQYKLIKNKLIDLMVSNGFEEIYIPRSYAKAEIFNDNVKTDKLVTIEVPEDIKSKFFSLLKNETIQYFQLRIDSAGYGSIGLIKVLE